MINKLIVGNTAFSNSLRNYVITDFIDDTHREALVQAVINRWSKYEIATYDEYYDLIDEGETEDDAISACYARWENGYAKPTFNQHKDYYIEKMRIYEAMYPDLKDTDVMEKLKGFIVTDSESGYEGRHIDLPNKKISTDIYDYPSSGDKSSASDKTTDSTLIQGTYRTYLNGVRNIYMEFAERFSDCFMHTFINGGR